MLKDGRISLVVLLGGAGVVYAVSQVPALTTPSRPSEMTQSEAAVARVVQQERAYCETQPDAIDCQCFAQKSGQVLSHATPKVPSAYYADQKDLARGQAARAC